MKAQSTASEDRPRPNAAAGFGRFLLPSPADLIFLGLFIALSFGSLSPRLLWDADIGWHIRNGQNILRTHTVPRKDSFSATMSGHPWYAWEWLYDAAIGWIYNRSGLNGVVFISALVIASTLSLVFRCSLRRGGGLAVSLLLFVLSTIASSIHFLARPHVVGWLLAVCWFSILDTNRRDGVGVRRILFLPPLMLLWANLHGGFVLGFVLLGIYLFADILTLLGCPEVDERRTAAKRASVLMAIGGASFLASMVNPYGISLHIHVYQYLTNRFLMQHINEFRRPDFNGIPAQAFLLMIALAGVAIVAARGRMRWANWLLVIFAIFSGMYAARNIPFASMLLMMVTAPLLTGKLERRTTFFAGLERWRNIELAGRIPVWPILVAVASAAICLQQGHFLGKQLMAAHFDPSRFPVQTTELFERQGDRERIFSLDAWGGYFIYRLYPENKVYIDDRHDFYGEPYIRDYLKVIHLERGWEQVLDQWKVRLIVMPSKARLSEALRRLPGWKVRYADATATMFERL